MFVMKGLLFLIKFNLALMLPIDNRSALVRVTAWYDQASGKYLINVDLDAQCQMASQSHN